MSYNIQHGNDHKKRTEEKVTVVSLDPVFNIVKKYNPDILNINEIYGNSIKPEIGQQLKSLGEKLGYNYYFVKAADVKGWGECGGALLSRFPISDMETHPIPNPQGHEDLETRAIGKVTVNLPNGKSLDILQSHFGGISSDPDIRKQERDETMKILLSLIHGRKKAMFMGDLNLVAGKQPDAGYITKIKNEMLELIDEKMPTFDSLNPTIHIDYMFGSYDMYCMNGRVLPEVYADHLPIMCEVDISRLKKLRKRLAHCKSSFLLSFGFENKLNIFGIFLN